jgi:hypothetical protein
MVSEDAKVKKAELSLSVRAPRTSRKMLPILLSYLMLFLGNFFRSLFHAPYPLSITIKQSEVNFLSLPAIHMTKNQ